MQQIITAKLKLLTTPEQHHSLRQTQLAYRDALNYVSRYSFEHGKPGRERVFCQYAPMRRTLKPKRHALPGMPSCGGVRMRGPPARERSTDLDSPRVNDLPIQWGGW
jgi:hypothetical protein